MRDGVIVCPFSRLKYLFLLHIVNLYTMDLVLLPKPSAKLLWFPYPLMEVIIMHHKTINYCCEVYSQIGNTLYTLLESTLVKDKEKDSITDMLRSG